MCRKEKNIWADRQSVRKWSIFLCHVLVWMETTSRFHLQYLQDPARAALFGKPSKGKAIAGKGTGKAQKGHESSDYDSDSEDLSESEGSDIKWRFWQIIAFLSCDILIFWFGCLFSQAGKKQTNTRLTFLCNMLLASLLFYSLKLFAFARLFDFFLRSGKCSKVVRF